MGLILRGPLGLGFWVFRFSFKECRASEPFRGGSVAYMGAIQGFMGRYLSYNIHIYTSIYMCTSLK